jgi:hypothetical protein
MVKAIAFLLLNKATGTHEPFGSKVGGNRINLPVCSGSEARRLAETLLLRLLLAVVLLRFGARAVSLRVFREKCAA